MEKPIRCVKCGHWTKTTQGMYVHWLREHSATIRLNGEIVSGPTDYASDMVKESIEDTLKNKYNVPANISDKTEPPVIKCLQGEK